MLDLLAQQVASPVQFVKGLHTLYDAGARVFVEVGPKKALQGFAEDVLGSHSDVVSLFTNHPKVGDIVRLQPGAVRPVCRRTGPRDRRSIARVRRRRAVCQSLPVELSKPIPVAASAPSSCNVASCSHRTATATTNSDTCSPTFSIAAGEIYHGEKLVSDKRTSGHHRSRTRPARHRAHLRRRQHRAHSARRSVHRLPSLRTSATPCSTNTSRAW